MVELKLCSKCSQELPLDKFNKDKSRFSGLSYLCRACTSNKHIEYFKSRKAREKHEAARYKRDYGLSQEDITRMMESQNNSCKICNCLITFEIKNPNRAQVDHCHKTGKVRGILCRKCNLSLGTVKDSIPRLMKMIEYLNEY